MGAPMVGSDGATLFLSSRDAGDSDFKTPINDDSTQLPENQLQCPPSLILLVNLRYYLRRMIVLSV